MLSKSSLPLDGRVRVGVINLMGKESGPKGPGFGLPLRGLQCSFRLAAVCCSNGVVE